MIVISVATLVVVVMCSPVLNIWSPGLAPLATLGCVALFVLLLVGASRYFWPGEYYADQAAAQIVGTSAVIEMLESFPESKMPSYTHPSPTRRIRRLRGSDA